MLNGSEMILHSLDICHQLARHQQEQLMQEQQLAAVHDQKQFLTQAAVLHCLTFS
jgi:hypothetical protein